MARKLQSDKWLFLASLALVCTSVVMVYSASAVLALDRYQQSHTFVTKQLMWALLGVALMSIIMRIDYRSYRNERVVWGFLGIVTVLLIAVLFSRPINGTRRWFAVGGLGIPPGEGRVPRRWRRIGRVGVEIVEKGEERPAGVQAV